MSPLPRVDQVGATQVNGDSGLLGWKPIMEALQDRLPLEQ